MNKHPSWFWCAWLSCAVIASVGTSAAQAVTAERVEAVRYAVTSGHPAATEAGLAVLGRGGNVMDAAVTTSLALGVAAPFGSGLGGKMVMLYRDGKSGDVTCVEALSAAPRQVDVDSYAGMPRRMQRHGYSAVCVPGLPAGLWEAHSRWGSLPWEDVVTPAAELAEEGIEFVDEMIPLFAHKAAYLRRDPEARKCYLVDGRTPKPGQVLRFADLANTLRLLAVEGIKPFYDGEIAEKIVAAARAGGSQVTMDDFRNYRPHLLEPLASDFRGRRVVTSPPPFTGGVTVLAALKTLEDREWESNLPRDGNYIDSVSRVLLQLYPRVDRRIADYNKASAAAQRLLSPSFIQDIRSRAVALEAPAISKPGTVPTVEATLDDDEDASTSHLVVADADGNIVCLTQSLSFHFGASVVVPGTGILMNNSMSNFNLVNRKSVNALSPGKRPRSTVAPVIVEHQGQVEVAFGIPGGQRIPSTTIQLLLDVIAADTPLPDAFERPRFHLRRPIEKGEAANVIDLEEDTPAAFLKELEAKGWTSVAQARDGSYFGGGNGVQYLKDGRLLAVADSRRVNAAGGR